MGTLLEHLVTLDAAAPARIPWNRETRRQTTGDRRQLRRPPSCEFAAKLPEQARPAERRSKLVWATVTGHLRRDAVDASSRGAYPLRTLFLPSYVPRSIHDTAVYLVARSWVARMIGCYSCLT